MARKPPAAERKNRLERAAKYGADYGAELAIRTVIASAMRDRENDVKSAAMILGVTPAVLQSHITKLAIDSRREGTPLGLSESDIKAAVDKIKALGGKVSWPKRRRT